ncbi:MAG: hypothetical protein ACLPVO_15820 [Desulfomonilaceae bacterium]
MRYYQRPYADAVHDEIHGAGTIPHERGFGAMYLYSGIGHVPSEASL